MTIDGYWIDNWIYWITVTLYSAIQYTLGRVSSWLGLRTSCRPNYSPKTELLNSLSAEHCLLFFALGTLYLLCSRDRAPFIVRDMSFGRTVEKTLLLALLVV
jgi:hypothetical protein